MKHTRLIVRMSKTARFFFKSDTYVLKKEGDENFEMNYTDHTKIYDVLPGTHQIEIGSVNTLETKEVSLKKGETKTLTINPVIGSSKDRKGSLNLTQLKLLILGLSIGCIIGMFLYYGSVPFPLIFIPLIVPLILLFSKNKKEDELGDFHITVKNKAIVN